MWEIRKKSIITGCDNPPTNSSVKNNG